MTWSRDRLEPWRDWATLTTYLRSGALAGVINVVGHINIGLAPTSQAPRGKEWSAHIVRTTASFSTGSRAMRWLSGGLTHHLALHLRPVTPRAELPALHRTLVPEMAALMPARVSTTSRSSGTAAPAGV